MENMTRKFLNRQGEHQVGNERAQIWYDPVEGAIRINLCSLSLRGKDARTIAISVTSLDQHYLEEGDLIPDFLKLNRATLEDLPGFLPALYFALKEFFGDSLDVPHPGVQHLSDMRKLVERYAKIEFKEKK